MNDNFNKIINALSIKLKRKWHYGNKINNKTNIRTNEQSFKKIQLTKTQYLFILVKNKR